ncbi:hypothetical protein TIFTF001_015193 [Ficus carica]|uniref:Uncharacterized protein n=1 Tax=Ficus carica TaxID=3494 RepID=A0AA87ZYA0_FICCA|nr:hypothetical protein TIFTF001_015193 [Ficus carica]
MSSNDYYDYITRLVRTPSVFTTDVPRYGNAPMFYRNTRVMMPTTRESEGKEADHNNKISHKKHQHSPHFKDTVEVFEYEQSSGDGNVNGNSANRQVCDDDQRKDKNSMPSTGSQSARLSLFKDKSAV